MLIKKSTLRCLEMGFRTLLIGIEGEARSVPTTAAATRLEGVNPGTGHTPDTRIDLIQGRIGVQLGEKTTGLIRVLTDLILVQGDTATEILESGSGEGNTAPLKRRLEMKQGIGGARIVRR